MLMGRIQLYLAHDSSTRLGDIHWYRGDSFPIRMLVKENGVPMDLTGCSFLLTVSSTPDPVDSSTRMFSVDGVIDPDQAANPGEFSFIPVVSDTDLASKRYYFDVQMVTGNGYLRTVAKCSWNIIQDITKNSNGTGWDAIPDWDAIP